MYKNSERFLTAFNRIEKKLRGVIKNDRPLGFSKMVHMLKRRDAIVSRYSDELLAFAALRNAIVHNKVDVAHVIAEPHDSTVERIEQIEKELLEPWKVSPQFMKKVISFQHNEHLTKVLEVIHEKKITKLPIYHHDTFKGLISHRAIALWLARNTYGEESKLSLDTTIGEVLAYGTDDNYRFISEETSVLEAIDIFKKQIGKGSRLEALLITKNGNSEENLKGIITNFDIMSIQDGE
jgi:predicted transcriptional regulator